MSIYVGDSDYDHFIISDDKVTIRNQYSKKYYGDRSLSEVNRVVTVRTQYGDELRLYSGNNLLAVGCPCASDDLERVKQAINDYRKRKGLSALV